MANEQVAESNAMEKLLAAARVKRTLHRFKIPKDASEGTVSSVGLVQLTITEEVDIGDSFAGKRSGLPNALCKASLVEVDGKTVSDADDSREIAWARMSPKARNLVLLAYNTLHLPKDPDVDVFLKSEEVIAS